MCAGATIFVAEIIDGETLSHLQGVLVLSLSATALAFRSMSPLAIEHCFVTFTDLTVDATLDQNSSFREMASVSTDGLWLNPEVRS